MSMQTEDCKVLHELVLAAFKEGIVVGLAPRLAIVGKNPLGTSQETAYITAVRLQDHCTKFV